MGTFTPMIHTPLMLDIEDNWEENGEDIKLNHVYVSS